MLRVVQSAFISAGARRFPSALPHPNSSRRDAEQVLEISYSTLEGVDLQEENSLRENCRQSTAFPRKKSIDSYIEPARSNGLMDPAALSIGDQQTTSEHHRRCSSGNACGRWSDHDRADQVN
jgi:hypothetical protein